MEPAEGGPQGQGEQGGGKRRFRARRPRPRGWHRWTRLTLEILLSIVAGLIVLAGFLIWRLSEGPVPLTFLTPRLLAAFDGSRGTVDIGETLLVWDEERSSLDLRVRDLTFRSPRGGTAITLPETNLTLSVGQLLAGRIVVTELEVLKPSLTLLRLKDGRLAGLSAATTVAPTAEGQPAPTQQPAQQQEQEPAASPPAGDEGVSGEVAGEAVQSPAFALLDRLLDDDASMGPLSSLEAVTLVDADVVLDDRKSNLTWNFPAREIVLRRDDKGVSGTAELSISLEGKTADFNLIFVYNARSDILDLSLRFDGVNLATLPQVLPELAALKAVDSNAGGSLNATIGRGVELALVDFDVTLSRGTLYPDELSDAATTTPPPPPIVFSGGTLTGVYDGGKKSLELHEAKLLLGAPDKPGPVLEASGLLQPDPQVPGRDQVTFEAALDRLPVADLEAYWPPDLAPAGREWTLANISGGEIDDLKLSLAGTLDGALAVSSLNGTFGFKGLSVSYLYPMPPATGASGTAKLDLQGLVFDVASAQLQTLALGPVTVSLLGFDQPDQSFSLRAQGSGPIPALLALLAHPRLNLLEKMKVDPANSAGTTDFTLAIDFPLVEGLTFDQVVLKADGTLKDLRMAHVVGPEAITADHATISVDNTHLSMKGVIGLAGSAFDTDWQLSFTDARKSRLHAKSDKVVAETVHTLLPSTDQPVSGSLAIDMTIDGDLASRGAIQAAIDLRNAELSFPFIDWTKKPGEAANARLRAQFDKGRLVSFEDIVVTAPDVELVGRMGFTAGPTLAEVKLSKARLRDYNFTDVVAAPAGGGWTVAIGGGTMDARPVLEQISLRGADVKRTAIPVTIEPSRLQEVTLPGGSLQQVQLSGRRGPEGIEALSLTGELVDSTGGGVVDISLQPDAQGRRQMSLKAANMGALLRVLGIADTVVGGTLRIDLTAKSPGQEAALAGTVEGREFRLVKAPVLAKILLVATLTGIGDALDKEGIPFERLTGDISLDQGVLRTQLLRAYGGSIGITAKGSVDFEHDQVNIEGTVVPAYSINRVLGQIPIIGWILTGGEGGGLLAVTYSVSGQVGDPQVSVNPLSALTPGFLRGLFDLFDTGDGTQAPAPTLYPDGPQR